MDMGAGKSNGKDLTKSQILRIARNLQAGFSKDKLGAPREWAEVDKAEQQAWIRTARRAVKLLLDREGRNA